MKLHYTIHLTSLSQLIAATFPLHQYPFLHPNIPLDNFLSVSRHWGQLSTYQGNRAAYFDVEKVGLPNGCQTTQVHLLQRHAERFPHPGDPQDGLNIEQFTEKVGRTIDNIHATSIRVFHGPLAFLNSWQNMLGGELLTGVGAISEIKAGAQFWNDYGRHLYNASSGQLGYADEDAMMKPLLRGTTQTRMRGSLMNWALGFFGPSHQANSEFPKNWTDAFHTLLIPEPDEEAWLWNNTLASHHSCNNSHTPSRGDIGNALMWNYTSHYLPMAATHLSQFVPPSFNLTTHDVWAMQLLCAYESSYISRSEFCALFTKQEWEAFEQSLDIRFFYNHAFGNPTARAQGIGYVQELLARLKEEYIKESHSSVNSSLTNNDDTFPLGMKFYADFTHDKMILATLTALSIDYFHEMPILHLFPPKRNRRFKISRMVPFTARLVTEVITCDSKHPQSVVEDRVRYYAGQYGYRKESKGKKYRFVRMRLNGGVLPLSSIRGGKCEGRSDGLCALDKFIESQKDATERAKYAEACFGEYEVVNDGRDLDGTVPKKKKLT